MKIVIDTNVVASAIFIGGKPRQLLELLVTHKLEAFVSSEITTEYQETVAELCSKYPSKPIQLPLSTIIATMTTIEPKSDVHICRDPDDNKFLNCAIDGKCIYIVSGDKDLLSIGKHDSIQIVTVAEFFQRHDPSKF